MIIHVHHALSRLCVILPLIVLTACSPIFASDQKTTQAPSGHAPPPQTVASPPLVTEPPSVGLVATASRSKQRFVDLFDLLFTRNLDLHIARLREQESDLDRKISENDLVPNASLQLSNTRRHVLDGEPGPFFDQSLNNTLFSFTIEQTFSNLGKANILRRDLARLRVKSRKTETRRLEKNLLMRLVTLFFTLAREAEIIKVHRENLRLLDQLHNVATINVEAGVGLHKDILRIEVQQTNFGAELLKTENTLDHALVDLGNLLAIDDPEMLAPELPPSLVFPPASWSIEQALPLLIERDPDLALVRLDREIVARTLRASRHVNLPRLSLHGTYNHGIDVGPHRGTKDYVVTVALSGTVFNSGDSRNEVMRVEKQMEKVDLSLERLTRDKRAEVLKAVRSYEEICRRVLFVEKAMEQSRENMRVVLTRYQAGDASITELIDAQITLTDAARNSVTAYHDERLRLAELLILLDMRDELARIDLGGSTAGFALNELE